MVRRHKTPYDHAMTDLTASFTTRTGRAILALVVAIVTVFAVIGSQKMVVNSDVVDALRGESDGFLAYEAFDTRFQLGRGDEVLLIRADDLAAPDAFEALENLILDLQFTDGVSEVVSLFTLTAPGTSVPLILVDPDTPLEERFTSFHASGEAAQALVTEDRGAALLHVIATEDAGITDIADALPELLEFAAPLSVTPVGQQAVDRQISNSLERDQTIVTPVAVLIAIVVGFFILRSAPAVLVCTAPAICSVLWFTGLLGWVGQPLDPWLATLPTLVMVLAFADALHLFYAAREHSLERAMREVLPAAGMTSLTSALALASFALTGADALEGLAFWGPIAMACGFACICTIFPLLAGLVGHRIKTEPVGFHGMLKPAYAGLKRPRVMVVAAVVTTLALLPTLNQSEPTFSLSEHIREASPLGQDMAFMEEAGLGSASLYVEIMDADGQPELSAEDRERIAAVASVMLEAELTPDTVVPERFVANDGASVALPVFVPVGTAPEQFGEELEDLRASLAEAGLDDVAVLAGPSLLAHEVVPETVEAMRLSFYFALAMITVVVAVALRSIRLAVLATIVSALPMLAIETVLVLGDWGMSMTIAFSLTVAFGITVDNTIHLLNRWQRAKDPDRLGQAVAHSGPPMVASTLLMSFAFTATALSGTASLPQFGAFVIFSLWMALIVDLIFLPGLVRVVRKR